MDENLSCWPGKLSLRLVPQAPPSFSVLHAERSLGTRLALSYILHCEGRCKASSFFSLDRIRMACALIPTLWVLAQCRTEVGDGIKFKSVQSDLSFIDHRKQFFKQNLVTIKGFSLANVLTTAGSHFKLYLFCFNLLHNPVVDDHEVWRRDSITHLLQWTLYHTFSGLYLIHSKCIKSYDNKCLAFAEWSDTLNIDKTSRVAHWNYNIDIVYNLYTYWRKSFKYCASDLHLCGIYRSLCCSLCTFSNSSILPANGLFNSLSTSNWPIFDDTFSNHGKWFWGCVNTFWD